VTEVTTSNDPAANARRLEVGLEDNLSEHWRRDDVKTNLFSGVIGDRDRMSKDGGSVNVLKNLSDILLQKLV
jgi:hypothetical protein